MNHYIKSVYSEKYCLGKSENPMVSLKKRINISHSAIVIENDQLFSIYDSFIGPIKIIPLPSKY